MDSTLIEHFVIFKTFFGITAHTGDAIKNDSVFLFYLGDKLFPLWTVLGCSGEELSNDSGIGIDSCDISNLTGNLLVLGADAAISIDHNKTFLILVLKLTLVSFGTYIMSCFEPFVSGF